jgi:DNA-binding transcriptional ArsR family regulator
VPLVECPPGPRQVSVVLFGNRHKLELLAALAEAGDDGVNLSQLSEVQGVSPSVYYGPLRDLMRAGLVDRLGRRREGDRRCWYGRRRNRFWDGVRSLVAELAEIQVEVS